MRLEPEMRAFMARTQEFLSSGYWTLPVDEQRRLYGGLCRAYAFDRPAGLEVRDLEIPGPTGNIPVRLYRKREPATHRTADEQAA